nr:germin-like protein subfamily 1 member 13 [Quercus suber]
MMKGVSFHVTVAILALASSIASAYNPSPLQDFCVAINDIKSGVFVNGKFCKDPTMVSANNFSSLDLIFPETLKTKSDQMSLL